MPPHGPSEKPEMLSVVVPKENYSCVAVVDAAAKMQLQVYINHYYEN
jgi:hypothetical protein